MLSEIRESISGASSQFSLSTTWKVNKTTEGVATIVAVFILTCILIFTLWYAVSAPLDHDEHQFMASAFLVAHYGLQPYRDFAYFHMPNLVYLYALFFLLPHPFMLARLFSGICGFGLCLALFMAGRYLFAERGALTRLVLPIASAALLVNSPLFAYTISRVWNHAPSTLCAILAFFMLCRGIRGNAPFSSFLLSGVGLGMAVGIRLSFAPVILPFLVGSVFFRRGSGKEKALNAAAFTLGGIIANLPAVYFFLTSYDNFLFGNLGYAKLNTIYREGMPIIAAMSFVEKVKDLKNSVFVKPGELLILLAILFSGFLLSLQMVRGVVRARFEVVLIFLVLPFLYLGAIAPTPAWYQYYFDLIPFMILAALYTVANLVGSDFCDAASLLIALCALVGFAFSAPGKNGSVVRELMSPESWTPIRLERAAEKIATYVNSGPGHGEILTLSPLYAVPAGLPIFKEFVTGPFAWRVSHLVSEETASKRGMPVPTRIKSFLEQRRPRALLTGAEEQQLEAPLINAAQQLGYQPITTGTGIVAWISPK